MTHHIAFSFEILDKSKKVSDSSDNKVYLPNGKGATVSHVGNTYIFGGQPISDVLFLPDFKINLLSISKLTKELQYMVALFPNFCIFRIFSLVR